jgi:ribosomal protein L30E
VQIILFLPGYLYPKPQQVNIKAIIYSDNLPKKVADEVGKFSNKSNVFIIKYQEKTDFSLK